MTHADVSRTLRQVESKTVGKGHVTTVRAKGQVTIPAAVREADEDIAAGRVERFESDEEFLAALEARMKPLDADT